jgi:hypothetical protein
VTIPNVCSTVSNRARLAIMKKIICLLILLAANVAALCFQLNRPTPAQLSDCQSLTEEIMAKLDDLSQEHKLPDWAWKSPIYIDYYLVSMPSSGTKITLSRINGIIIKPRENDWFIEGNTRGDPQYEFRIVKRTKVRDGDVTPEGRLEYTRALQELFGKL